MKKFPVSLASVMLGVMLAAPGQAQMRGKYSGGMVGHVVERRDYEVRATDLAPVFPASHACNPIASPYGSPHRFDGSVRRQDRNSSLHGGLDISLDEATPLLAIAAGKVIAKGEGGNLEGFYLWMLHAPEDTGLRFWSFVKYQHLVGLPAVNPGDRVSAGQAIAHSGLSGTIGPAFGPQGYPHLHVSLHIAPGPDFDQQGAVNSFIPPKGGKLADPMLMFLPADRDFARVEDLPAAEKRLPVAAVTRDGRIHPAGSKLVWPVYCSTRAG